MLHLTIEQTSGFYAEYDGKEFFKNLIKFMTSDPIIISVVEEENAVQHYRNLLSSVDLANALTGTLRAKYTDSLKENGTHSSDFIELAKRKTSYFFSENEICLSAR